MIAVVGGFSGRWVSSPIWATRAVPILGYAHGIGGDTKVMYFTSEMRVLGVGIFRIERSP